MCGGVGIPAAVGVWMVPVALLQLMKEMGGRFQAIALDKPHNNPLQYRSIVEPHSFITHKLMLVCKLTVQYATRSTEMTWLVVVMCSVVCTYDAANT